MVLEAGKGLENSETNARICNKVRALVNERACQLAGPFRFWDLNPVYSAVMLLTVPSILCLLLSSASCFHT